MASDDLYTQVATQSGITPQRVSAIAGGMRAALLEAAAATDSVAIPGFGTFTPEKESERIGRDLSTGHNVMLPPRLDMRFKESGTIRNALKQLFNNK